MNKLEMMTKIVNQLKNGTFVRFGFETDVPIKAALKDDIKIKKTTFITARTGVAYKNLKRFKDSEQGITKKKANNYSWIINNKIKYNSNTDKYYIQLATNKNANIKCFYQVYKNGKINVYNTKKSLQEKFGEYCINSYFKEKEEPAVMSINIDNVIKINKTYLA